MPCWAFINLICMTKYKTNTEKKQDIMDKSTMKKRKNGVLDYGMRKVGSGDLVTRETLERSKECNTLMMMVAGETREKKQQHEGNTCKTRFCPICAWKKSKKDALALSVMMAYIKQEEKK